MVLSLAAASPWVVVSVTVVVGAFSVWGAIRLVRRLERVAQERPVSAAVQRQRARGGRHLARHPLPIISNRRRLEIMGLPALGMFVVAAVLGPLGQVGAVLSMVTVALIFVLGAVDGVQVSQTERALLVLAAIFGAVIGMSLGLAVG